MYSMLVYYTRTYIYSTFSLVEKLLRVLEQIKNQVIFHNFVFRSFNKKLRKVKATICHLMRRTLADECECLAEGAYAVVVDDEVGEAADAHQWLGGVLQLKEHRDLLWWGPGAAPETRVEHERRALDGQPERRVHQRHRHRRQRAAHRHALAAVSPSAWAVRFDCGGWVCGRCRRSIQHCELRLQLFYLYTRVHCRMYSYKCRVAGVHVERLGGVLLCTFGKEALSVAAAGVDAPDECEREREWEQVRPTVDEGTKQHEEDEPVGARRIEPTHGLAELRARLEHAEDGREVHAESRAEHTQHGHQREVSAHLPNNEHVNAHVAVQSTLALLST